MQVLKPSLLINLSLNDNVFKGSNQHEYFTSIFKAILSMLIDMGDTFQALTYDEYRQRDGLANMSIFLKVAQYTTSIDMVRKFSIEVIEEETKIRKRLDKQSNIIKKRGMVVCMEFPANTSFAWSNGLYVIIKIDEEDTVHMCKLSEDGKLETLPGGKLNISCTGAGNKSLHVTRMTYKLSEDEKV